jgi:hypothetical protein
MMDPEASLGIVTRLRGQAIEVLDLIVRCGSETMDW